MKKLATILLAIVLIAGLFVSCENNVAEGNIEETVGVNFVGSRSRALNAQLESFDKDSLYWMYSAVKKDSTGLESGATSSPQKVKSGGSPGLGSVSGFSQGSWEFTLYAYKTNSEGTYSDLKYQGTIVTSLKKGNDNSVMVTVSPVKTGCKGTLTISDGITITKNGEAITTNTVTKVYKVVKVGDTGTDTYSATTSYDLDPGAYKVTVAFAENGYVYASGSVVATVYSNLETTVTGSLEELRTDATFDSEINPDVMNTVATSTDTAYSTLSGTEASAVTLSDSASSNKVTATVPAESAKAIVESILKGNDDTVTVDDSTTVSLALSVDTTAATESTLELEIGMSATVTAEGVSTTESISSISDYATVEINLQTGLTSVVVKHSGSAMDALESSTATPTSDAGGYYYDESTGVLTIKTKTFSPFAVSYNAPVYVAKVGSKHYTSLEAAVKAAEAGSTITLLDDLDLTNYTEIDNQTPGYTFTFAKNVTLEMNGKTITSNNFGVVYQGDGLKIQNGSFVAKDGGSYALFIGNGGCNSGTADDYDMYDTYGYYKLWTATIENIKCTGGINVCVHRLIVKSSDTTAGTEASGTDYYALWTDEVGQITVEGGTFTSASTKGGSVLSTCAGDEWSFINIEGGNFAAKGNVKLFADDAKITISGGTFSVDPSGYLDNEADGKAAYKAVQNNDGTWSVISEARIGEILYANLQDAVDEATENDTVTLLENVTVNDTLVLSGWKNVTLDFNGNTITGDVQLGGYFFNNAVACESAIFKDSAGDGGVTGTIYVYGSGLTIESGNYLCDDGYNFWLIRPNITIKGGTFSNTNGETHSYILYVQYQGFGTNDGSVTIEGGDFSTVSDYSYIMNGSGGPKVDVAVTGGTFETKGDYAYIFSGEFKGESGITIGGGNFETSGNNAYFTNSVKGKITINGCTFASSYRYVFSPSKDSSDEWSDTNNITVNGGTFTLNSVSECDFVPANKYENKMLVLKGAKVNWKVNTNILTDNNCTQSENADANGYYVITTTEI